MKVFCIGVVQELGGNVYVKAKNVDEAREFAAKLVDAGSAQIEPDPFADEGFRINDARECGVDEKGARALSDNNAEALEELTD